MRDLITEARMILAAEEPESPPEGDSAPPASSPPAQAAKPGKAAEKPPKPKKKEKPATGKEADKRNVKIKEIVPVELDDLPKLIRRLQARYVKRAQQLDKPIPIPKPVGGSDGLIPPRASLAPLSNRTPSSRGWIGDR